MKYPHYRRSGLPTTSALMESDELSSMTRQCIKNRRFGDIEELRKETSAWATAINSKQRGVDWQFKIDDARVKLKSLYPKIQI